jgi:DNA-binding NtrC family response regulator
VKLLRVMENRVITPVGGNKDIKVDTRVVAATSRDIRDMMAKGTFREDLYYRLNVITIELPPLRQRLDDIPLLVKRFMERVNQQNGTKITSIAPSVIDAMQEYGWPGNVRELLNIVERMMVLTDKTTLEADELPAFIRGGPTNRVVVAANQGSGAASGSAASIGSQASAASTLPAVESSANLDQALSMMTLSDLEDRAIAAALGRFNNNRTRAARALGISVRTLQRKLGAKNAQDNTEAEGSSEEGAEESLQANTEEPNSLVGSGSS